MPFDYPGDTEVVGTLPALEADAGGTDANEDAPADNLDGGVSSTDSAAL